MAKPSESVRAVITQLPDVLNNEEDIDKLDRAINFLEKAVDELDEG